MSKDLNDLCPTCRPKFEKLIELAEENFAWDIIVVDTLRTPEEQAANLAKGVSWTKHSKHLPQACGKSHAIDIAPQHLAKLKNWAPKHHDWVRLGVIGESLGLRWGGRWADKKRDCPHFECNCNCQSTNPSTKKGYA